MVNQIGNITSIAASVITVVVVVFGLARWGSKIESSIQELKDDMKEVRKTSHIHRRFGYLGTALATILLFFKG